MSGVISLDDYDRIYTVHRAGWRSGFLTGFLSGALGTLIGAGGGFALALWWLG